MRSVLLATLFITTVSLGGRAEAASVYSAGAFVNLALSTSIDGGLDSLRFVSSRASYSAGAVAVSDGTAVVDGADITVEKSGGNLVFGTYFDNGGKLGDLLLVPSTGPVLFDNVDAAIGGARAQGDNATSSPGQTANIGASVNGHATDPVEFAASSVRWDVLIGFQNIGAQDMVVSWTLAYLLRNSATADPRGTADSVSGVQVRGGGVCDGEYCVDTAVYMDGNAACDPVTSDCDFGRMPPNVSETRIFQHSLAPDEIRFMNFEVLARGSATVVPLPGTFWLLVSALAWLVGASGINRSLAGY